MNGNHTHNYLIGSTYIDFSCMSPTFNSDFSQHNFSRVCLNELQKYKRLLKVPYMICSGTLQLLDLTLLLGPFNALLALFLGW